MFENYTEEAQIEIGKKDQTFLITIFMPRDYTLYLFIYTGVIF